MRRYLAYGSNLCLNQMRARCPAAEPGPLVALPGWRFVINRRGVATLLPCPGGQAWGLIWQLTRDCEAALDRYEGVASGHYTKAGIEVGGSPALLYLATETAPGFPRPGYLDRVVAAAAARGLDAATVAELAAWAGAVTPALVRHVLAGYRLPLDGIHGSGHWLQVLENGRILAAATPGADPALVELFALLHDSRRRDEEDDRGHGERAAAFVRELAARGALELGPERVAVLAAACDRHERGEVSADPTIGCCWDADRLELARLGRRPIARLLSTAAALDPGIQAAARQRGTTGAVRDDLAEAWSLDAAVPKQRIAGHLALRATV
jgi:uncharacterized protein